MTENTNGGKEPPSTNAADPDPNPVAEEEEDPVPSTSRGLVASVASGSGSSSSSSADRFRRRPYRRRKLRSEINASEGQEQDNHEDQTSEDDEDEEEVDGAKRSKVRRWAHWFFSSHNWASLSSSFSNFAFFSFRRNTTHSPPQYDLSALSVSSSSSASSSPSSASSSPSSSPLRSNGDEGDGQESIPRPAVLSKEPPKCPYNSVKDLIGREYRPRPRGWERKHHFLHNRMGSLEMVQRFELAYKLEQHEGCVNALSFNERGINNLYLETHPSLKYWPSRSWPLLILITS